MLRTDDDRLWKVARKRAQFKQGLAVYVTVNLLLWGIWYVTMGKRVGLGVTTWPLYVTLGWGVGVAFSYLDAYGMFGKSLTEREFERLKAQRDRRG